MQHSQRRQEGKMLHLGDDGSNDENIIDEISLPLTLSAGVLYIIQRFLNQVDENDMSEDSDNYANENGFVEVDVQVEDSDEEERREEPQPTSGEGDRQPTDGEDTRPSHGSRVKRYRMPWTRIRRSNTPCQPPSRNNSLRPSSENRGLGGERVRSRSPLERSRLSTPPNARR